MMKARMVKDVAILCPRGWMMGGQETDDFEAAVRGLIEQGNRKLVVDLTDVAHMNSSALGTIIGLNTAYINRQGKMKLCHLDAKIQNILVVTRLALVFDVYGTEREAVASFASEAPSQV
jgi:anti-sigma B factor antagonist